MSNKRLSREELIQRVVEVVVDTGESWITAAMKFSPLDVAEDDAGYLFHRGLGVEAQTKHREGFRRSRGAAGDDKLTERYLQDALQRMFQGADGRMRAVLQFVIEDDDAALSRLAEDIAGREAQVTFFSASRSAKLKHGVQRISELSGKEQERLRAMAEAAW